MPKKGESKRTPALIDSILADVSLGRSIASTLRRPGMPDQATWWRWVDADRDLRDRYARAKEQSADVLAEEILEIADEDLPELPSGGRDSAAAQRQRLRVDARKWIAAKLKPKKYGDAQRIEHSGEIVVGLVDRLARARARVADG
jgi:hypothetical protein